VYKIEEVKGFVKASDQIIKALKNKLSEYEFDSEDASIEELSFEFDGQIFALRGAGSEDWISEGKYENGAENYQLVSFDNSEIKYPCTKNITNYYNIILNQSISRSGSYYTDWYYSYFEPTISVLEIVTVAEVIIPEHEGVIYKTV